jgi:hypothetical protein
MKVKKVLIGIIRELNPGVFQAARRAPLSDVFVGLENLLLAGRRRDHGANLAQETLTTLKPEVIGR